MRVDYITSAVGLLVMSFGITFLIPGCYALFTGDYRSFFYFISSLAITELVGVALHFLLGMRTSFSDLKKREAMLCVVLCWISASLAAGIPYLFYGFSVFDAIFEATSGIASCGSTVLCDFSAYPKAFFLWRSFTQWIGGLGIVIVFITVLPQFAVAGRQLFFAESTGVAKEKLAPRLKDIAVGLACVYLVLTLTFVVLLRMQDMPFFDCVCNVFSLVSGGGLSPHPKSIMGYGSMAINWIVILGMFFAGCSFVILYKLIFHRNVKAFFKDTEFMVYLFIIIVASCSIFLILSLDESNTHTVFENITDSIFQVLAIISSTGFASTDFGTWNNHAQVVLLSLMFTGASAGSACGGIKIIRVVYLFKYLRREIALILHPRAVIPIKINKSIVSDDVGQQIIGYIFFYIMLFVLFSLAVSFIEGRFSTGVLSVAASLGNVGPGFGELGPMNNFSHLKGITKILLSFIMIMGRLELIPFLALLNRDCWAK